MTKAAHERSTGPLVMYLVYRDRRVFVVRPVCCYPPGAVARWPYIISYAEFPSHARVHYLACVCRSAREARAPLRAQQLTRRTFAGIEFWMEKGWRFRWAELRRRLRQGRRARRREVT
jgi:hypothetical protein